MRVYLLGAGASYEVGVPLIRDFMPRLLEILPASKTRGIEQVWQTRGEPNVEQLLADIDSHLLEGRPIGSRSVEDLHQIRGQLIVGISDTIARVQYDYLSSHYGYKRSCDYYYYWARRQAAMSKIDKKTLSAEELNRQIWDVESTVNGGFTLAELPWSQVMTSVIESLFRFSSDAIRRLLVSLAWAGGRSRVADWLGTFWPLIHLEDASVLNIPMGTWSKARAIQAVDELIHTLGGSDPPRAERLEQERAQIESRDAFFIPSRYEFLSSHWREWVEEVFPALTQSEEWLRKSAMSLTSSDAPTRVNPYPVLGHLLDADDSIVSLNYDLNLELGLETQGRSFDYELSDMMRVRPWDPHGPLTRGGSYSANPILKLHGSVNWLRCKHCDSIYAFEGTPATTHGARRTLSGIQDWFWESTRGFACCQLFEMKQTEVPIIAPILGKGLQLGYLAETYASARDLIALSDELIVIGYSLSPTDKDVRRLLTDAVGLRSSSHITNVASRVGAAKPTDPLRIVVVDPGRTARRRFSRFVPTLGAGASLLPMRSDTASAFLVETAFQAALPTGLSE